MVGLGQAIEQAGAGVGRDLGLPQGDPKPQFDVLSDKLASKSLTPTMGSLETSGVNATQAELEQQRAALGTALANKQPITTTPVTTTPTIAGQVTGTPWTGIGTVPVPTTTLGAAQTVNAAQRGAVSTAQAGQIGTVAPVNAAQIGTTAGPTAATIAPTANTTAGQIAPTGTLGTAQVATTDEQQLRAKQLALANQLEKQASGQTPTLAELQLKQDTDRAIAQQKAVAASARGGNVGLANIEAGRNIANLEAQAGQTAAQSRIAEQKAAQESLANVLGGTRATDVSQAQAQAQLTQQSLLTKYTTEADKAKAQASLDTQTNLANQNTQLTQSLNQAKLTQDATLAKYTTEAEKATAQAQLDQAAQLANQATSLNTLLEQAKMTTSVNLANAQAYNDQDTQNAQLRQQTILANQQAVNDRQTQIAQLTQQAALANRQITSDEHVKIASMQADIQKFNVEIANQTSLANQDAQLKAGIANQAADLQAKGMTFDQTAKLMGMDQDALVAILQSQSGIMQASAQQNIAKFQSAGGMVGGLMGAVGSLGAAMIAAKGGLAVARNKDEEPEVEGDDHRNDKINAYIAEGEMVIPKTTVDQGPEAIKAFAEAILSDPVSGSIQARNNDAGKMISEPKADLVSEHERIVKILRSLKPEQASHEADVQEAELEKYKNASMGGYSEGGYSMGGYSEGGSYAHGGFHSSAKKGTKEWINDKTSFLIQKEKYDPKQAYAIAHSMAKENAAEGGLEGGDDDREERRKKLEALGKTMSSNSKISSMGEGIQSAGQSIAKAILKSKSKKPETENASFGDEAVDTISDDDVSNIAAHGGIAEKDYSQSIKAMLTAMGGMKSRRRY